MMSERERIKKLNQLFFDNAAYLVFQARQIIAPNSYGHFALIKGLDKVLELQKHSKEIDDSEFYDKIRNEMKSVSEVSSSDIAMWRPFLDKLAKIFVEKMKTPIS